MRFVLGFFQFVLVCCSLNVLTACLGSGGRPAEPDTPTDNNSFSASVSWDIPSSRANGEELLLSEIGGYVIEYRLRDSENFVSVVIEDPSASEYTLANLAAGDYEVRIAVYDTLGLESEFSSIASSTVGQNQQ